MLSCSYCATRWVGELPRHFHHAILNDLRLNNRLVTIAKAWASRPGASWPRMFEKASDTENAYYFFSHPMATPDNILAGHFRLTRRVMHTEPGIYLLPEDTSEFAFDGCQGMGPIGGGTTQGFHLHSTLVVRLDPQGSWTPGTRRRSVEIVGLAAQEYYIRQPRPKDEPRSSSFHTRQRQRESQLWERSSQTIGRAPDQARWVRVGDRGADIYSSLDRYRNLGHGWVVRACYSRCLEDDEKKLFEVARSLDSRGEIELELRSRPGVAARQVKLHVAWQPVVLRSPAIKGHAAGTRLGIGGAVIRVWEQGAGKSKKALEWVLHTDRVPANFEQARELIGYYSIRWIIEEFHRVLKEGLRVERQQFETAAEVFASISVASVVALKVMELREWVRLEAQAPATESGLSELQLKVLAAKTQRKLETVQDVALAIGRLGGHMNRKGDGMPGHRTMYLGMSVLHDVCDGYQLAMSHHPT